MKSVKLIIFTFLIQLPFYLNVQAGEFAWLEKLAVNARIDPDGIKTKIAARFHIGDAKIKAVINDVGSQANAYMVLRLAEMSHKSIETVVSEYQAEKGKGWGVMARRLGIKPGSREFHALKRGHDLDIPSHSSKGKWKSNGKGHGQGNDKNRGNGKNQGNGKGHGKGRK